MQEFKPRVRGTSIAMTNAERQQRWRDKHRPSRRKAVRLLSPDGTPATSFVLLPPQPKLPPMTNAERQQRWRDKHRSGKRRLAWDAQGKIVTSAPFNAPTPLMPSPPPPSLAPTPPPAPVAAEHNDCPHCGSCLRKRAKTPKLAA